MTEELITKRKMQHVYVKTKTAQPVLSPDTKTDKQPQTAHARKAITMAKVLVIALVTSAGIPSATIASSQIITGALTALLRR